MNNFRYNAQDRKLWLDMHVPDSQVWSYTEYGGYKAYVELYNNRLHYSVSPELDALLEDGQVIGENEFKLKDAWEKECYPNGDFTGVKKLIKIAIPLPEQSVNFHQVMPDSHFWTSIKMLLNFLDRYKNGNVSANYLIIGLQNTLKNGYDIQPLPEVKEDKPERLWAVGDVFTTTFWGEPEVCIIQLLRGGEVYFVRLESIRMVKTIKDDYCMGVLTQDYFHKIQKTFIHHSQWHSEYRH